MGVYPSAIVGLGYVAGRAEAAAHLRVGAAVDLVRDYDNAHDDNAVAVYSGSAMLGFIPARHAEWVSEIINCEQPLAARVVSVELAGFWLKKATSVDPEIFTGGDAAAPISREERFQRRRDQETYREAWSATKGGLQVLRWLGEVGKTPLDRQRFVMDGYIHARASDRGLSVTSEMSEKLRDAVMSNTGARSTAMTAARKLACEDDAVEALAPCVTAMVKADHQFTTDEVKAVQDLLNVLRRTRDRAV